MLSRWHHEVMLAARMAVLAIVTLLCDEAKSSLSLQDLRPKESDDSVRQLLSVAELLDSLNGSRSTRRLEAAVSIRPRLLVPGKPGRLFVVVTLPPGKLVVSEFDPGNPEVPVNPRLSFKLDGAPLSMSRHWKVSRPSLSKITGFEGKLVFDDILVYEIPVTVPSGSTPGDYVLSGSVAVDLHQSSPPTSLGQLKLPFRQKIVVRLLETSAGRHHVQSPITGRDSSPAIRPSRPAPRSSVVGDIEASRSRRRQPTKPETGPDMEEESDVLDYTETRAPRHDIWLCSILVFLLAVLLRVRLHRRMS